MKKPESRGEPLVLADPEPEPIAVKIRAVFGFVVGLGLASAIWLALHGPGRTSTVLLFTVVPVGLAYGSARWGGELWTSLWDEF